MPARPVHRPTLVNLDFGVIGGVLSLVAVLTAALVVTKAGLSKGTIELLQQNNVALTERVDLLEADNARQAVRLSALTAENIALQTYVSGTDAIKILSESLATADRARAGEHHDILAAIHAAQAVVQAQHEEVLLLIRTTVHSHGAT